MKKFLMIGLGVLSLSACDTVKNMQMPDMSSLNPFGTSTAVTSADTPAASTQPSSSTANEIEMAEMQKLMGNTPRFDMATPQTEPVPIVDLDTPNPIDPQTAQMDESTPIPSNKPSYATPQPQITKVNVEPTPPAPAPEPIEVKTQANPVAPTPIKERDIAPMNVVAPTAATTSDIAIFNEQDLKLSSAKGCPTIEILPAGRSITYFENEMSGYMVARAVINEIRGGCEIVNGGLEIDLDIFMDGKISDKGRFEGKQDMEAFMTFPYFVAVFDPQGLPVDKKILATAMRFKPIINDLKHAEKITQFIPMSDTKNAANYKILVGFQLNRKQLEYNRARTVNRVDNKRISPDTIPAARRSTNPLAD